MNVNEWNGRCMFSNYDFSHDSPLHEGVSFPYSNRDLFITFYLPITIVLRTHLKI